MLGTHIECPVIVLEVRQTDSIGRGMGRSEQARTDQGRNENCSLRPSLPVCPRAGWYRAGTLSLRAAATDHWKPDLLRFKLHGFENSGKPGDRLPRRILGGFSRVILPFAKLAMRDLNRRVLKRLGGCWLLAGCMMGASVLLTGCKRAPPPLTICAIPQLASQELYLTERAGMEEAAANKNIRVDWKGPSDSDPQRQIDIIASAIAARRYGIAINPVSSNTTGPTIMAALEKGIPVAVLRDPILLQPQPHLSFLLEDYGADAELIARRLNLLFSSGGEVAILGVDPYSASSLARLDATERALKNQCPHVRVVDRVIAPYSSGMVQIGAEKELDLYPHLLAFIALNNRAGLGAAAAILTKTPKHPARVLAFDQSLPLLLRLRRGQVDSIVAQNMLLMGRLAVANIDADRHGRPYEHLTRVEPMLITAANVNDEELQDALLMNWEKP